MLIAWACCAIFCQVIDRDRGKGEEKRETIKGQEKLRQAREQDGTWGTDTMTFQDDELSYALGKQGGTRTSKRQRERERARAEKIPGEKE